MREGGADARRNEGHEVVPIQVVTHFLTCLPRMIK